MIGSERDWVSCPICTAGSPAGISICPRCRYRFRISAGRESPEFEPNPSPRSPLPARRRRGQFTLGMVALVIAATAFTFVWPGLLVPACSVPLILLRQRSGFSFIAIGATLAIVGVVLGLALPLVTH